MAIRDLLWACPICGREGALRPVRGAEACIACGTRYSRGRGSTIVAEQPGAAVRALPAAQWADLLPAIEATPSFQNGAAAGGPLHRERARMRCAIGESRVQAKGVYMNRIERFAPPIEGELILEADRLRFLPEKGGEDAWHFDTLTAVQPSSSTLQIKARGRPVVSFRFPEGSARFWEEILTAALRRYYQVTGQGEILEFQPRIVAR